MELHDKKCLNCGEKFKTYHDDWNYCSAKCYSKHTGDKRRYRIGKCKFCGEDILSESYEKKFCDKECRSAYTELSRMDKKDAKISYQVDRYKKGTCVVTFTEKQWEYAIDNFKHSCAYCGEHDVKLTQEHFIPVSKGGNYTKENIIPVCRTCNASRCNRDFILWYKKQPFFSKDRLRKILEYLGYI